MIPSLNRRMFLARGALALPLLAALPALERCRSSQDRAGEDDEEIFQRAVRSVRAGVGPSTTPGEVVAAVGRQFLGAPYVAHLLEEPADERLVVNLRQFDCLLLVESSLAIARTLLLGSSSYDVFRAQLMFIRYRGGVIREYPSRLHYFTDWVADNVHKGVLEDVTRALGGGRRTTPIRFMSTHTESYRQLSNPGYLEEIRSAEERLSSMERYVLPVRLLEEVSERLRSGDVIGTVSSVEGLDIAHSGLLTADGGMLRFLHAPLSQGKVEVAPGSFIDYLERHSVSDIVVARPLAVHP